MGRKKRKIGKMGERREKEKCDYKRGEISKRMLK